MKAIKTAGILIILGLIGLGLWYQYQAYAYSPTVSDWQVPAEVSVIWDQPYIDLSEEKDLKIYNQRLSPVIRNLNTFITDQNHDHSVIIQASDSIILKEEARFNALSGFKTPDLFIYRGINTASVYIKSDRVIIERARPLAPVYIDAPVVDICENIPFQQNIHVSEKIELNYIDKKYCKKYE